MQTRLSICVAVVVSSCVLAGCGRSREQADREKQRLQVEEQAQRDLQKSNQAVNEVSKKLGRKPPTLDLGVPTQTQPATQPPQTPAKP